MMAEKKHRLLASLVRSFSDDPKAEHDSHETLQKYSTQWIQPHHVINKMIGTIEKFDIQGQTNKHKALQSLFHHYQCNTDHQDEHYAHIIHVLLQLSDNAVNHNTNKPFRDLRAIVNQIESSKLDQERNEHEMSVLLLAPEQLSEWEHEWEECDEELSEWSNDSKDANTTDITKTQDETMSLDEDDDDDDVIIDMEKETPMDPTILQIKSKETNEESLHDEAIVHPREVTQFEALICALMGVDTIYFKWRKDQFVCLGSGCLMTECCSLLHYANYYRDCKNILDDIARNTKQTPLCIKSFFNVISELLQIYRENLNWFISSKYYETQSILELSYFMSQSFSILEWIYVDIIHHFHDEIRSDTLQTHHLISHLFELLLDILCDEYSVHSSTIMSLFLGTISPYFDILDEWLFGGRLMDPFQEFFVQKVRHIHNEDTKNIWNKYVLCKDRIPCFLFEDGIAESILINGKSLQILRHIQRETNKECKLPSKPYESSFEYLQSILTQYYPLEFCIECINPKQKQSTASSPTNMLILSPAKQPQEIMFGSPGRKKPISHTNNMYRTSAKPPMDPVQIMTWISTSTQVFAKPLKPSSKIGSCHPKLDDLPQQRSKNPLYFNYYEEQKGKQHDDIRFIQKEMVYIPFQHIVKGQLLPKISAYCFEVNQLLLNTIDLLPHLVELRLLFFIEASDILNPFLASLIDILATPGWAKQLRICDTLQASIYDSVYRERLPRDNRISVEWSVVKHSDDNKEKDESHLASVVHQINKLFFNLHVEWPLNIIITPAVIHSYNRIFKFLLQLKTSKLMLEQLDMEMRAKSKRNRMGNMYDHDDVIHQCLMFRHKLYLFITTFNNYCSLQIAADSAKWDALIRDICDHCYGLDEIQTKHHRFIQDTLKNLFLPTQPSGQNVISSHIIRLLLCCHDLQKIWNKDITEYIDFKQEISNVKQSSLFQHEKNKLWRLRETATKSISFINVKFERLYKFCLVTIDKIKNKSLSQTAINVVLHLDFNNFYANAFQIGV